MSVLGKRHVGRGDEYVLPLVVGGRVRLLRPSPRKKPRTHSAGFPVRMRFTESMAMVTLGGDCRDEFEVLVGRHNCTEVSVWTGLEVSKQSAKFVV